MPSFVDDPANLSKSRLKSDLVAHNVALPPGKSKKEVYVKLHLKHIGQKTAADFSSDEEDQAQDVEENKEENPAVPDLGDLTDDELKAALLKHGVKVGPIVASTRAVYERKLLKLLQPDGHGRLNGTEKDVRYSDSGEEDDAESDREEEKQTSKQSEQVLQEHSQVKVSHQSQNDNYTYPQCFLLSSRLVRASRKREHQWYSGNALKASERSRSRGSQISVGISRASSVEQRSGLGSGVVLESQKVQTSGCSSAFSITQMVEEMEIQGSLSASKHAERELSGSKVQKHWSRSDGLDMRVVDEHTRKNQSLYFTPKASPQKLRVKPSLEPVADAFTELLSDTKTTPTGIYASRRRPIKGAAGRPVQYVYPDTPTSPTTLERREVARRLVPIHIQLLVFIIVACLLYLIYVCVEDNSLSPLTALLDSLMEGSDIEDGLLHQDKTQATTELFGQE